MRSSKTWPLSKHRSARDMAARATGCESMVDVTAGEAGGERDVTVAAGSRSDCRRGQGWPPQPEWLAARLGLG